MLSRDRFEALAAAYGGDIARWPAETRDDAAAFLAADLVRAQGILAGESRLDALLDDYRTAPASHELVQRIVAGAPRARPRWAAWLVPAGLGAALAGACAAGLIVGVQVSDPAPLSSDAVAALSGDLDLGADAEEDA
ncbi:MAG: hypothetical protein ABI655_10860 [Phenylobacterium sp.]